MHSNSLKTILSVISTNDISPTETQFTFEEIARMYNLWGLILVDQGNVLDAIKKY
jgi:hypothetical protein